MKLGSLAAIALAACAALHAPHAVAQSQTAPRCPEIDNDAQRLACYDRALRPAPAPSTAPTATANTRAPAATPPQAVDPVAAAPGRTLTTENRATRPEREVRESTASAPPAAPAAPSAATPRRAPAATQEQAPELVPIVIVQIRALPGRAATFVTDTGDTWIQTDNQRLLPTVPFKAAIKPGSVSSFFLVPDDFARSFRVRRGQ